jgi:hypothetical protein
MYNISISQSANNQIVTDFITLCANNFAQDILFRANETKLDTTYNLLTSITSTEIFEIHNTFVSDNILTPKNIFYIVPQKLKILNWTIISDVQTTASIDVLSSDYNKYNPTNSNTKTLISRSNKPILTNQLINSSLITNEWSTNLVSDSILIFNLTQNTAAKSISIILKVTKI